MEALQRSVNEFRKAMDLEVPEFPRTLSPAEAELHIQMIRDEFEKEFVPAFLEQNLVEMYDAGIDVLVYVMGALSNAGFDIEPGFKEIMRSNMSKMDPVTKKAIRAVANDPSGEPEGKILKGPAYSPPNLHPIINETFRFGESDILVYRTQKTPITMGIGGPQIGEGSVTMDHNGTLVLEGTIFDTDYLPQVGGMSIYAPEEVPAYVETEHVYVETTPVEEFVKDVDVNPTLFEGLSDEEYIDNNLSFLRNLGVSIPSDAGFTVEIDSATALDHVEFLTNPGQELVKSDEAVIIKIEEEDK